MQIRSSKTQEQSAQPQQASAYHKISPEEAKEMMDGKEATVVDVRTPEEYEEGHIPGAVNIPNEEIGDTEPDLLKDKDAVLLIHCRSGVRSKAASDKLVELGYTQIYDFGGIIDWPYETVKED
ncbi:MAG: rhodanese-like domain-containing protein [Clostridium sp.]|nr:rhodanese-like domain-containing protein [Clostridium sp.]